MNLKPTKTMDVTKWMPKGLRRRIEQGRRILAVKKRHGLIGPELPLLSELASLDAAGVVLYPRDRPGGDESLMLEHLVRLEMARRVTDSAPTLTERIGTDRLWGYQLTAYGRRVADDLAWATR